MGLDSALAGAIGAVPAGVVVPFAGSASPSGWLLCHGQAVSRTDYGALFSAVGTTYGAGDGSTTFNLPDLRGRVVAGLDNMGGSAASRLTSTTITGGGDNLGETGGAESVTLTINQMPSHNHTTSFIAKAFDIDLTEGLRGGSSNNNNQTYTSSSTGGGKAHPNVQPTMVLNYIIKASAY